MSTDHAALKAEIDADPEGLGYKDAGGAWKAPDAILALLLARDIPVVGTAYKPDILRWAAGCDALRRLEAIKAQPDAIGAIAYTVLALIATPGAVGLDFAQPDTLAAAGGLVQAGVFTQSEIDTLLAYATTTTSRAAVLGMPGVAVGDITYAATLGA